ncbi:sulfotransferase family protein [Pseudomonas sp. LD120]|uniref:sulfotransferase family protein n=1 Tax=Pseudomonas sp. LD120 TaxID=485751 RepID=UPI00135873F8|nr:sulfotransferase family protein [Pseudomonas sp. LD120]KAF0864875.1 sulfotransferase family protein [Pseudomonas sp. LD120]
MEPLNLQGWLPIRIWQAQQGWRVDWCWFAEQPLLQPFFRDAVDQALRLPFNQALRRETPLAALQQWQRQRPGLAPSAFIFHASRCGSTLVSQMLAQLEDHIVLSEPPPLDTLLRAELPWPQRVQAIQGLVSAYGQPRRGGESRLVIKLDAWNIGELPWLRQCFPDTPWLFIYRDPLDIAVSHLRRPGMHMVPGMIGPSVLDTGIFIDRERFIAQRLGRLLQRGLDYSRAFGGQLLNYQELPQAMERRLGDFFALTAAQRRAALACTQRHAKQPDQVFLADTEQKRQAASAVLVEHVQCWARGPYERLERWRQRHA